ncbi:hypothetical protein M0D21_02270 [Aquimarina sp. D1M17]|uniref:hypothetical protein n=1 Tax=Aquimarina acroporae TaxID=2937283 RepID=UPI0020C0D981|nr:hypothetical protein [Aquimarina acroporae]MCK8520372.1 hypothetical protein [Aquimarina acroporae]
MDKKEEELLSMHYQIEKTDIKQQQLEDRLVTISDDLRKSKVVRNLYFAFIVVLLSLLVVGGVYLQKNTAFFSFESETAIENSDEIKKLLVTNDSLMDELNKLKVDISEYKKQELDSAGIGGITGDSLNGKPKLKFERNYCYVNRAYESNGTLFIEADFIEFYKGKRAVKKAKEFGEAEYDIDKNGDTLFYLYNNYYIHNQNSSPRILELDDKARVKIDNINQISNGFPLKAFQRIIKDKPVLILETSNGIVYRIIQQKLP